MRTRNLLSDHSVTDLFTAVYVLLEDYLQASERLLNEQQDELSSIIGDKGNQGLGIYIPPKANVKEASFWCDFFARARKTIEAVFSSLTRCRNIALQRTRPNGPGFARSRA